MSDKSIQEMTLQMKKEMHAKSKKIDEFKPLSSEIKRIQDINSSFRDTTIPGSSLSKVLPQIFVKKITVDNNPDNTAGLEDTRRDPHISDHPVYKRSANARTMNVGRKRTASFNPLGPNADGTSEFSTSVELTISVKQLFDDDDMLYEILRTLNLQDYLKLKIIAVLDNPRTEKLLPSMLNTRFVGAIKTNEDQGLYVIGHDRGIPIPQDFSKGLSPLSNDFEVSSDGSIIKNTIIKRAFQFSKPPEDLAFFIQAYYDIFSNPDFENELGVSIGSMLKDSNLSKILISQMKSEVVFRTSQLMSQAAVFTESIPGLSSIGDPYMGEILEIKPDVFAKPANTTRGGNRSDLHTHRYYVDSRGNGYTNVHTDRNNRKHIHMIRSFRLSSSGTYGELEETFREDKSGAHIHNLPIAASNALYRRMVPIDYIVDNRSQGSLMNLRVQTNKTIEDAFSFLKKARTRSNILSAPPGSNELSPLTCRNSKQSYFTPAMISSDTQGNCRLAFGFDYLGWVRNNTKYGKFMTSVEEYNKYAKISSVKILRKKITNSEYSKKKTYKDEGIGMTTLHKEDVVCEGNLANASTHGQIYGKSATATIEEFTPAGAYRKNSRASSGRYFAISDRAYSIGSTTSLATEKNRKKKPDSPPVLNSGIYSYAVEIQIIDNTSSFLVEAQSILNRNIKKLSNYISIGQRKENHSGVTKEFTKAFKTRLTSEYAKDIVDDTMVALSRVFIDETGKTLFTSARDFKTKAKKMHNAIRPKSGSLFAAERYLTELRGIVRYLEGISGSNEIGPYAARKQAGNNPKNSDFPKTSKSSKLVSIRFNFNECYNKSVFENSCIYFKAVPGVSSGLSEVKVSVIHPNKDQKGRIMTMPEFGKLESGKVVRINEKYIKETMFSSKYEKPNRYTGSGNTVNTFKIVNNQTLLKEREFKSNADAYSTRNVMGDTELEKQILDLQEDGWLSDYRKPNRRVTKTINNLALGSELVEQLKIFKNQKRQAVLYFSGIKQTRGSFAPSFSILDGIKLRRLARENRPILCKLMPVAPSARKGEEMSLSYDNYFFVMPDQLSKLYSPARISMGSVLEIETNSYNSEVMSTNPMITDAKTTGVDGRSMSTATGRSSQSGSGMSTGSTGGGGY